MKIVNIKNPRWLAPMVGTFETSLDETSVNEMSVNETSVNETSSMKRH